MKKLLLTLGLCLGLCAAAQAQVSSQNILVFTNLPALVNTNTATALSPTTNQITLWHNAGLALQFRFSVSATNDGGIGNSGLWIRFSPDGTNYPNAAIALLKAANSNNTVTISTNWSPAQLAGFSTISVQITNSNDQLTNSGVLVNQWRAPSPW